MIRENQKWFVVLLFVRTVSVVSGCEVLFFVL